MAALIGFVLYNVIGIVWVNIYQARTGSTIDYDGDITGAVSGILPSLVVNAILLTILWRWSGIRVQGPKARWDPLVLVAIAAYLALAFFTFVSAVHRGTSVNVPLLLTVAVGLCFVGFNEELLFRGLFLNAFGERVTAAKAVLFSGIAFGLFHAPNVFYGSAPNKVAIQVLLTTLAGCFLGWLYVLSGRNFVLVAAIHAFHDFILIAPGAVTGADQPTDEALDSIVTSVTAPLTTLVGLTIPLIVIYLCVKANRGWRLWQATGESPSPVTVAGEKTPE